MHFFVNQIAVYLIIRPPQCFAAVALSIIFISCQKEEAGENKFSDPVLVTIANYQDKRLADSLYPFLNHEEARYRQEAVLAFGSLQEADNIDRLGKLLLMDPDDHVRRSAAFALGQIQHPSAERILLAALVKEKISVIVAEILNAYGKTTARWQLDPSSFIQDSVKSSGLAWSLYRAALRDRTDTAAHGVAMRLLSPELSLDTRLAAAHYFARPAKNFPTAEHALITATQDPSPDIRMACALALGKIKSDSALATLKRVIKSDNDTRVIVNCIRAMRNHPYERIKHYLYEALGHKDTHVGVAASEVLLETVTQENWIEVSSLTNQVSNPRIRANLYAAALKAGRNKDLATDLRSNYEEADDPYDRAAYLGAMAYVPDLLSFVVQELREADTAVIRSTAAGVLAGMSREDLSPSSLSGLASQFKELLQTENDAAVLGTIASALADSTREYRRLLGSPDFLHAAKKKLRLPEDNEALQAIEAAIAQFEGRRNPAPVQNEYNHPIDWPLVKSIPADQLATIKTARGNITMRLLVNEAPGSVGNFVALARANYFDNKLIHRVVPNFVIQDGCKRGDGWGGEDYSIRSEFSLRRYTEGSVGMASAGKDTEGTQWFITHSITPHLDGRYTIFAEVVEGQKVVNYLQVGDKINDVVIENFTAE